MLSVDVSSLIKKQKFLCYQYLFQQQPLRSCKRHNSLLLVQCASPAGPRWRCSIVFAPRQSLRGTCTWRTETSTPPPYSGGHSPSIYVSYNLNSSFFDFIVFGICKHFYEDPVTSFASISLWIQIRGLKIEQEQC